MLVKVMIKSGSLTIKLTAGQSLLVASLLSLFWGQLDQVINSKDGDGSFGCKLE